MEKNHKNVTLDDLAVMVAEGFNDVSGRLDKVEGRLETVESRLDKVEISIEALRSSVNNYLELSDKRYLELKAREKVIVGWVKQIADKTGVAISWEDLEKVA